MQAVLVMFRSDGERRSFSVTRDMTVVGRREDCDLRIPLSEVSRKHARLVRDGDTLRLEDLGSSNGTFLNGQRVQEAVLNPGDSVQIGPVVFVLQVNGFPVDEELTPVPVSEAAQAAPAGKAADMSPLSPTAQSEHDDVGHLDPLPLEDDIGLANLEPLPMDDEVGDGHSEPVSRKAEMKAPSREPAHSSAASEQESADDVDHLELPLPEEKAVHAESKPVPAHADELDLGTLDSFASHDGTDDLDFDVPAAHAELESASADAHVSADDFEPLPMEESLPAAQAEHAPVSPSLGVMDPTSLLHENDVDSMELEPLPEIEGTVVASRSESAPPHSTNGEKAHLAPIAQEEDVSLSHSAGVPSDSDSDLLDLEPLPAEMDMDLPPIPDSLDEPEPHVAAVDSHDIEPHVAKALPPRVPAPIDEHAHAVEAAPTSNPKSDLSDLDDDFLDLLDDGPKESKSAKQLDLDLDLDLDLEPPRRPHL